MKLGIIAIIVGMVIATMSINVSQIWDSTVEICTDVYQQTKNEVMYNNCWAPTNDILDQKALGLIYNISGVPYMFNGSAFHEVITQYHTNGTNDTVR